MLVTIDFETYYDNVYSLKKLTPQQYINDPQFEVIGAAIAVNEGPVEWFVGSALAEKLESIDWANTVTIAHNAAFDGAILSWVYDIQPKILACTMSMARSIGITLGNGESLAALAEVLQSNGVKVPNKGTEVVMAMGKSLAAGNFSPTELAAYGEYCKTDVTITRELFHYCKKQIPDSEMHWQNIVLKAFTEPEFLLDPVVLLAEQRRVVEKRALAMQKLMNAIGVQDETALLTSLRSGKKFAEVLESIGVTPGVKLSPSALKKGERKETFAFAKTDQFMLDLLEHPNELAATLAEAKLGLSSSIEVTRVQRMLDAVGYGKYPIPLKISGAHTHRLGGMDKVNVQNLPSGRTLGQTKALRQSIIAPPGYYIVGADASQIEARLLAWVAGQNDVVSDFYNGVDPYCSMAADVFRTSYKELKDLHKNGDASAAAKRTIGKALRLGCGYGLGHKRFVDYAKTTYKIDVTPAESEVYVRAYRDTNSRIVQFWDQCSMILSAMISGSHGAFGGPKNDLFWYDGSIVINGVRTPSIRLPDGMWLRYPELRVVQKTDPLTGKTSSATVYKTKKGKALLDTYIYGGKLTENLIQALSFALLKMQGRYVAKKYRLLLNVHDEHVTICKKQNVHEAVAYLTKCMTYKPDWAEGLPLDCEVGYAEAYGNC